LMLLRMLLLKRLSQTLYRFMLAGIVAFVFLFLAFAAECGYLMYQELTHLDLYPSIHTVERRR
jgi:hypothetical protein